MQLLGSDRLGVVQEVGRGVQTQQLLAHRPRPAPAAARQIGAVLADLLLQQLEVALLVLDRLGEVCQLVLVVFDLLVVLLPQTGLLPDVRLVVVETLAVLLTVELVHLALALHAALADAVVLLAALLKSARSTLLELPRHSTQFSFLRFASCPVPVF